MLGQDNHNILVRFLYYDGHDNIFRNKNCLGKNVAVEAEDGNLIEGCIDENYPSNANDLHLKYDCRKEDDVLNDRSNLLSSDNGHYVTYATCF